MLRGAWGHLVTIFHFGKVQGQWASPHPSPVLRFFPRRPIFFPNFVLERICAILPKLNTPNYLQLPLTPGFFILFLFSLYLSIYLVLSPCLFHFLFFPACHFPSYFCHLSHWLEYLSNIEFFIQINVSIVFSFFFLIFLSLRIVLLCFILVWTLKNWANIKPWVMWESRSAKTFLVLPHEE